MKTQPHHDFYKDRNETEDLIAIQVFGSHVLKLSLIWFQNICKNILTKIILEKKIISSLCTGTMMLKDTYNSKYFLKMICEVRKSVYFMLFSNMFHASCEIALDF